MSEGPPYILDADVFIEANKRYYAFDLVPKYWETLIELASDGIVLSIDRVKDELDQQKDELSKWANSSFHSWFASTNDDAVLAAYAEIMQWAQTEAQYSDAAKAEFADVKNADAWLIAYARAKGCIVVTHEQLNPTIKKRIPIPNVCNAFKVPFINSFEMLRALGVRLA